MSEKPTFHIKATFDDELRRFSLSAEPTFTEIDQKVRSIFVKLASSPSVPLSISYIDEAEDWIRFDTDLELHEALRILHENINASPGNKDEKAPALNSLITMRLKIAIEVDPEIAELAAETLVKPAETQPKPLPQTQSFYPTLPHSNYQLQSLLPVHYPHHHQHPHHPHHQQHPHQHQYQHHLSGRPYVPPGNGGVFKAAGEKRGKKKLLLAIFVEHSAVPDNSILLPGQHFHKVWKFRNETHDQFWPSGTKLAYVSKYRGDQLSGPDEVMIPDEWHPRPQQSIEVGVDLVAPTQPGIYAGWWRLTDPSGKRFGHRVRVQIRVAEGL